MTKTTPSLKARERILKIIEDNNLFRPLLKRTKAKVVVTDAQLGTTRKVYVGFRGYGQKYYTIIGYRTGEKEVIQKVTDLVKRLVTACEKDDKKNAEEILHKQIDTQDNAVWVAELCNAFGEKRTAKRRVLELETKVFTTKELIALRKESHIIVPLPKSITARISFLRKMDFYLSLYADK